jgi:heat shock protein HslJ
MRALFLAAALAACSQPAPPPAEPASTPTEAPVLSDEWRAASLADTHWAMSNEPANTAPLMDFGAVEASGTTGCNSWSARYRTNGAALGFQDVTVTERACGSGVMETEQAFLAALRDTEAARMEGEDLVLLDIGGAETARFHPVR